MPIRRVAVLVAALASSIGTSRLHAQVVRENVAVEVLSIRLTARDGTGKPVENLSIDDLSLTVDGKPVAIDTLGHRAGPDGTPPSPEAPPRASPRPLASERLVYTLIFTDEGDTEPADRRVVYDELDRFLRAQTGDSHEALVARFDGDRLEIACPWTDSAVRATDALKRLRQHPSVNRLPSASELSKSGPELWTWLRIYRQQLHRALLEAIAAFPEDPGRRQLLVVSGGTALMRPTDLATVLADRGQAAEAARLRQLPPDERATQAQGFERSNFALWAQAVSPEGDALTMSDVVAKALERDIAIIPVAAEAIDRGALPGMDQNAARIGAGVGSALSGRVSTTQVMTEIAARTGSEPILVPGRTAAALSAIETRPGYTLTFREPAGDHRYHQIELASRRPGVTLAYRRGYRVPTEDERALDTVVARLLDAGRGSNPLNASASLTSADSGGRALTRIRVRIEPPLEAAPPSERDIECIAVGETPNGSRTEPVRWEGTARPVDGEPNAYALVTDLGVPYGTHRWSIAVKDVDTGLVSFLLLPAGP